MTQRRSVTSTLYRAARASNNLRAAKSWARPSDARVVRQKTYRASGGVTRSILKSLGLSK
jgi:hypothetical protein